MAEFDDSALLKVFGADGVGIFAAPETVAREIEAHYRVEHLGTADGVIERFYAISAERRLVNPAVLAISAGRAAGAVRRCAAGPAWQTEGVKLRPRVRRRVVLYDECRSTYDALASGHPGTFGHWQLNPRR